MAAGEPGPTGHPDATWSRRTLATLTTRRVDDLVALGPPPDPAAAEDLVTRATAARLTGPLLAAVDAGDLRLGESPEGSLVEAHRQALLWCVHLEARLLEVRGWWPPGGGPPLVLKGPAVAHLDEVDPGLRTFADVDLLVPAADLDGAVAVLEAHGGRRRHRERRPGYDRRFAKSVTVGFPDGVEVDLHRTLCDGALGTRIPLDGLFATAETFTLAGHEVGCLSTTHRVLHAAYHAVLGSPEPPPATLRDLAGYLGRDDVAVAEVVAEARRWGGEAVLVAAVDAVLALDPHLAPGWRAWAATTSVPAAEAALVARHREEGSGLGRGRLHQLRALPPGERLAFAWALAVPSRAHLSSRGRGRGSVYRDALARASRAGRQVLRRGGRG